MPIKLRSCIARLLWLAMFVAYSAASVAQQPAPLPGFDPKSVEHVLTSADAERIRKALIRAIWHHDALPPSAPDKVGGVPSLRFDSDNLADAVVLTRTMEFGIESLSYYYRANRFAGCLFIYHGGHSEGVSDALKGTLWKRLLDGGCDLLYVAMPLAEQNPMPVVQSPFGPLLLKTHDTLALLQSDDFNPIKLFVDPVLASLNYLNKQRDYRFVFMAGFSGGGWTTTLYAALDPRISASFPVAGSLPESIKSVTDRNMGDWEQSSADIYRIANYLDLYLLGTHPGRTQVQLLNVNDPCCFRGAAARSYEGQVGAMARQWHGSFAVGLDEKTMRHELSAQHMETILGTISNITGIEFPPPPRQVCVAPNNEIQLKPPFVHEAGHAYEVDLHELQNAADDVNNPDRSMLVVCEDEAPLGPNHSPHDTVRRVGRGSFSHWMSYLLFSSSDNTDPNSNGRRYRAILAPR